MSAPRPRPSRRRRRVVRRAAVLVGLGAAFAVGVALGEALHDNPRPGGTQTRITTFMP
ncbi:MAG: hypothetical protein ACYDA3_14070 [Gaiellaceae bacterium]